jgi:hypothetical protein
VELIKKYLELKEEFKVFKGSIEWSEVVSKENVGKKKLYSLLFLPTFGVFVNFLNGFFLKTKLLLNNL